MLLYDPTSGTNDVQSVLEKVAARTRCFRLQPSVPNKPKGDHCLLANQCEIRSSNRNYYWFLTTKESVYCAVGTECFNIIQVKV